MAARTVEEIHRDALIVDGLGFGSDGYAGNLIAGNVAAINITVADVTGDFELCCDNMATWCARLDEAGSPWRLVLEAEDIAAAKAAGKIGLIMGWQNMRPIADRLERLTLFRRLGVRVMQLTYNERNFIGSGCLEPLDSGLSAFGKRAVREMNRLGIAVDLSHVAERTCLDAVAASDKPVLITHANAKAVRDVPRNKSDAVIKAVAGTGGLIGASVYGPMCWNGDPSRRPNLSDFVRHLEHIVGLVGIAHVSLGSDFPIVSDLAKVNHIIERTMKRYAGNVNTYAAAFGNDVKTRYLSDCGSPAELGNLTQALVERGWREADIRALLGENLVRVLKRIWATG
ncbi:MAG: dipeptidase [Alphaproteobacteria bacterium]